MNVRSIIPTNNLDANGNAAYANSAIAGIAAHERRRRIAAEKGYNTYFKESQIREQYPLKCGTICRKTQGEAKQLLQQYLDSMRSAAQTQFWSYYNQEQTAIGNENEHWLSNSAGLLTGYDPGFIHDPVTPPAFSPPSCPAAN